MTRPETSNRRSERPLEATCRAIWRMRRRGSGSDARAPLAGDPPRSPRIGAIWGQVLYDKYIHFKNVNLLLKKTGKMSLQSLPSTGLVGRRRSQFRSSIGGQFIECLMFSCLDGYIHVSKDRFYLVWV